MPEHAHSLTQEDIEVLRGCCYDDSRYGQYYLTRKKLEGGHCAFCQIDHKVNTVLYSFFGWTAWEVPTVFTNRNSTLALQIVFFPKRHVRHFNELSLIEWFGLWLLMRWIYKCYGERIPGGGFFFRVGDMRWNVGTVKHFHGNLYVPSRQGQVAVYFQKDPNMWEDQDRRMKHFSARYEAGEVPETLK
jgi:hypothetical protein